MTTEGRNGGRAPLYIAIVEVMLGARCVVM
jgi:hypothetical protein